MVKESLIVENKLRTIIKQEIRNILILNELNINKKSQLGNGQDFETYPSNKNPDRVIKSATTKYSSSNISDHINIFKKYPKYFPIVYKYNEKENMLSKETYGADEKLIDKYLYKYDEKGNKVLEETYGADGKLKEKRRNSGTYKTN